MITPLDIERATIHAWPAGETEERDGWFLLAASGVTGRVNAVWPIGWTGNNVERAIDAAEHWYAARQLPPRFKLTDGAVAPADLRDALARRGYEPVMHTFIMARALAPSPWLHEGVTLSPTMPPAFDRALQDSTPSPDELEERRSIARRAPAPAAFAVRGAARALAIGMSAIAGELAGVFLMRTVPEARRQGHARHILRALLEWAGANGAKHAFLQVDSDNENAVALYTSEGFTTLTSYRFWRKPN